MSSYKTGTADFDVAIVGGGPAGAATASYLGKAGVKCVVLERDLFPRPHVGESLVPATTRVFKDLGFLDAMESANFPHKFGAVWTANANSPLYDHDWEGLAPDCNADIRFDERTMAGVDRNYTYHVDRGKFDLLFLQHANRLGASVCEGVHVGGVDLDEKPHPRVHFRLGDKEMSLTARLVVDGSGRNTLLGRQLGLKVNDPVFCQFALHTWFDGYDRGGHKKADYIFIHFLPISNSWVWQIPINDTVTSFGVVTQKHNYPRTREARETFFWDCVRTRPDVYEKLRKAQQVRPLKEEGDYSYGMSQIAGDRFVLVGDAARFVDPIFSSGVSIALNSARLASKDILQALETGAYSRDTFRPFEEEMKRGTKNWYRFITLYYRLNVLFTVFIQDPRYRTDILKLLQGDMYDEDEPAVLQEMTRVVSEVESNPGHMWYKLLGDLTDSTYRIYA